MKPALAALVALVAVAIAGAPLASGGGGAIDVSANEPEVRFVVADVSWPRDFAYTNYLAWSDAGQAELHAVFDIIDAERRFDLEPTRWELVDVRGSMTLDAEPLRARLSATPGSSALLVARARRDGVLHQASLAVRFDGPRDGRR